MTGEAGGSGTKRDGAVKASSSSSENNEAGNAPVSSVMETLSRLLVIVSIMLAVILGFFSRIFSVVKYESVIHEFDPHFNFRVAKQLVRDGFEAFFDWFDPYTWYPLGRIIGGTTYPGIHTTSAVIYWVLNALNVPTDVREACVFTPPVFGGLTALAAFLFVREVKDTRAGLIAAFFMSVNTAYMSRSSAGGYDNEAVAIFCMVFTFYAYVKALKVGSLFYSVLSTLSFFYMVSSWGGYNFLMNLIPLHALTLIVAGRFSWRLYIAYTPFVVFGNLFAMNLPVIGFNAIRTSEHMASYFVFLIIHAVAAADILYRMLPVKVYKTVRNAFVALVAAVGVSVASMVFVYLSASPTFGWSGRSLTLIDPTYASKYIPIIASVAEHRPPTWNQYWQDFHVAIIFMPAGIVLSFFPMTDASLFLIIYGVTSVWFSGMMMRLMLVLGPAGCFLGAIGLSELLSAAGRSFYAPDGIVTGGADATSNGEVADEDRVTAAVSEASSSSSAVGSAKKAVSNGEGLRKRKQQASTLGASKGADSSKEGTTRKQKQQQKQKVEVSEANAAPSAAPQGLFAVVPKDVSSILLCGVVFMMLFYLVHCIYMAADFFSSPSVVMVSKDPTTGQKHVIDDFREAYTWLRSNAPPDAKVGSWWDYGYQTTSMAERTVLVDNNTWNNTHIATVGKAMGSDEETAWRIFKDLDTDYVLVLFGGLMGYSGDDINKLIWMVRIASGEYPEIQESNYMSRGRLAVDVTATKTMTDSLMFKLCYYKFHKATIHARGGAGYDPVRRSTVAQEVNSLQYFEEAFTSKNWLMRIYRVLDEPAY